jgi:hypothetical protein
MGKQQLTPKKSVKKIQKKIRQAPSPSSPAPPPSSPSPPVPRPRPGRSKEGSNEGSKKIKSQKKEKVAIVVKGKKSQLSSKKSEKTSTSEPRLAPELFERLSSVINIADIETNGFPEELWNSFSFEEKNSLPIFVSILFRSSETKEQRKRNQKQKRVINGILLKYQKQALHRYYLTNKKKIKKLQVEKEISGNKATELLWNSLSSEEKNEWYRQSSLEAERRQQESEEGEARGESKGQDGDESNESEEESAEGSEEED